MDMDSNHLPAKVCETLSEMTRDAWVKACLMAIEVYNGRPSDIKFCIIDKKDVPPQGDYYRVSAPASTRKRSAVSDTGGLYTIQELEDMVTRQDWDDIPADAQRLLLAGGLADDTVKYHEVDMRALSEMQQVSLYLPMPATHEVQLRMIVGFCKENATIYVSNGVIGIVRELPHGRQSYEVELDIMKHKDLFKLWLGEVVGIDADTTPREKRYVSRKIKPISGADTDDQVASTLKSLIENMKRKGIDCDEEEYEVSIPVDSGEYRRSVGDVTSKELAEKESPFRNHVLGKWAW